MLSVSVYGSHLVEKILGMYTFLFGILHSFCHILVIRSSLTLLTQALTALLSDDSKFGFIVIDGSGALFGTLQGNTREVLHKFTVDLPKKHGTDPQHSHNTEL